MFHVIVTFAQFTAPSTTPPFFLISTITNIFKFPLSCMNSFYRYFHQMPWVALDYNDDLIKVRFLLLSPNKQQPIPKLFLQIF